MNIANRDLARQNIFIIKHKINKIFTLIYNDKGMCSVIF